MKQTFKSLPPELVQRVLGRRIFWMQLRLIACFLLWCASILTLLLTSADMVLTLGYKVAPVFPDGARLWLLGLSAAGIWAVDWASDAMSEQLEEAKYTLDKLHGVQDQGDKSEQ